MVRDDSRGDAAGDEPNPTLPLGERDDAAFQTHDVTRILSRIEQGDGQAAEHLLPLIYDELRKLAAEKMAQEKPGQTLQATALVHEAYIRLVDVETAQHWNSRAHFFGRLPKRCGESSWSRLVVKRARRLAVGCSDWKCHRSIQSRGSLGWTYSCCTRLWTSSRPKTRARRNS